MSGYSPPPAAGWSYPAPPPAPTLPAPTPPVGRSALPVISLVVSLAALLAVLGLGGWLLATERSQAEGLR